MLVRLGMDARGTCSVATWSQEAASWDSPPNIESFATLLFLDFSPPAPLRLIALWWDLGYRMKYPMVPAGPSRMYIPATNDSSNHILRALYLPNMVGDKQQSRTAEMVA